MRLIPGQTNQPMLTTTGRVIIIGVCAAAGLGIGVVVSATTPLSYAEGIGAALGAGIAYFVTWLWI